MPVFSKIIEIAIDKIVSDSLSLAISKLIGAQKSHKVLSLLKKTGIVELQNDLGHMYLFTLAEYAIDRNPPELVKVFADESVKKAFNDHFPNPEDQLLEAVLKAIDDDFHIRKLKPIYANLEQPLPEVVEFCNIFKSVRDKANPALVSYFNEANKGILQLLEVNERNSFPFQITRHLRKQNEKFHDDYLIGNKYIHLNGEQRLYREPKKGGWFSKSPDDELDVKWDSLPHKPLDGFIEKWLDDDRSRMLVIMGEYGTGKTTFAQHLAHELAAKYLDPSYEASVTDARKRIPMYFRLLRFEKTLDAFITTYCSQTNGITSMNYAEFEERCGQGEFVVLFDGFDEMTQKMNEDEKERNLGELRKLLAKPHLSKIILTCREEYFLKEAEKRKLFDAADTTLVHLLPFDEGQVRAYLASHSSDPDTLWEQLQEIQGLDDLSRRPVLLDLIVRYLPDILARRKGNEPIRITDLYETCIEEELKRKQRESRKFEISTNDQRRVLKRLATWMFVNDTLVFDVDNIGKEINFREEFQAQTDAEVQNRLSQFLTFSFLIWDGDNRFRLSHKSFRDYLAAIAFAEEVHTGQAEQLAKAKLTDEVMNFMWEMNLDQQNLLHLVLTAKHLPDERKWKGTNAANLLLELDNNALAGQNLSECRLEEVIFVECDFTETSVFNSNLKGSSFSGSIFSASSLGKADFMDCSIVLLNETLTIPKETTFLKGLKLFICHSASISDLSPLRELTTLKLLDCRLTQIVDLSPVVEMTNLMALQCDSTQVIDLSPLSKLVNLLSLSCSSNQITNLSPVAGLVKLRELSIENNPITDLSPLHGLKNLKELRVSKGQFSIEALKALAASLTELEIYEDNELLEFEN